MRWLLLGVCLLARLAFAGDVFERFEPRSFSGGDRLENDASVGGYPVWPGERQWQMLALVRTSTVGATPPVPLGELRAFHIEGDKLIAVIQERGNLRDGNGDDWTDEPCKRNDVLFKASLGGKFRDVNCVMINHVTSFLGNPSESWATFYSFLKDKGIDVPPTVIRITFTRYSKYARRLVVVLTVNPEVVGFARDKETSWGRSIWHPSQAMNDPDKKRFIEALGKWAVGFGRKMDAAFEKKSDAFADIPSWRVAALPPQ